MIANFRILLHTQLYQTKRIAHVQQVSLNNYEISPLYISNIERWSRLILTACKLTFDAIHKPKFVIPNTSLQSITVKLCHYNVKLGYLQCSREQREMTRVKRDVSLETVVTKYLAELYGTCM